MCSSSKVYSKKLNLSMTSVSTVVGDMLFEKKDKTFHGKEIFCKCMRSYNERLDVINRGKE